MATLKRSDYHWDNDGTPAGCDSHCIPHPCGPCAIDAGLKFEPAKPQYVDTDCDLCSACRDHAGFVKNDNGEVLSECCDAPPMDLDCDMDMDR